ncbi:MAG: pantoate--beta-alanine ligase [Planctomycetota bacterium]
MTTEVSSIPILRTAEETSDKARQWLADGDRVVLVPTMGALHEGHVSLIRLATGAGRKVVVSIFVNPTQFGAGEDLARYPRDFDGDLAKCSSAGADLVFAPSAAEMYPSGCSTTIEPPAIAGVLEGEFRPGHFAGVCTVVAKLFAITRCDIAVFGRKDYQQARVIETMTRDLCLPVELEFGETIRESGGLAMSSRNAYLNEDQRQRALAISEVLAVARDSFLEGTRTSQDLEQIMVMGLRGRVDSIDYAAVVHPETLGPRNAEDPAVALIAARIGATRLIDNRDLHARDQ